MLNAFTSNNGLPHHVTDTSSVEALRQALWIDLEDPSETERQRIEAATGLRVPTEADVSEIESSSRLAIRENVLYLSLPLILMDQQGPKGVSAGFVLSPERLITVRFAPSRIFQHYVDSLPRGETRNDSGAHIFVGLFEAIIDRQADALEQIRADLDTLSHTIFQLGTSRRGRRNEDAMLRRTLGELGRIGDLLSHIRDTEVGAARIVPFVQTMTADWLPKELKPRLKTLRQDIASVSEFDTHLTEKLQFLLDATLGFINIAQNNVMKVMAVASVVGIPPVLVVGIYGMNFKDIPELNWAWGYPYAWALIVLTTLIPLWVFRWRKWI